MRFRSRVVTLVAPASGLRATGFVGNAGSSPAVGEASVLGFESGDGPLRGSCIGLARAGGHKGLPGLAALL